MKSLVFSIVFLATVHFSCAGPLRIQKRAAFYIANETACVVDNIVYSNGDPIPTDDPCESCKCRPPGFACVLKDCEVKPGCRAVRKTGHCCPDYICETIPNEVRNPYVEEKEPSLETTTLSSSSIVPGVSYVKETTEVPKIDTTVIEIFETKADEAGATELEPAVNLYAISAEKPAENEDSSESVEETEKKEVNEFINSEVQPSTAAPALTDSSSETSEEKSNSQADDEVSKVETITELTTELSEESSSVGEVSDATVKDNVEDSTELAPLTEEFNSPVVVENINVEPEEPSNTLELIDLPSDYGKSLRFPEQDVSSNANDTKQPVETPGTWKSILEESPTDSPISPEVPTSTKIPEESSQATSESDSDSTIGNDSTSKNLYYIADKAIQTESAADTVTTLIQVKEQTQSPKVEIPEVTPTPSAVENLFKSLNDRLEEEDKEKSTNEAEILETSTKTEVKADTSSEEKIQVSTESTENTADKSSKKDNVVTTAANVQADLTTVNARIE